MEYYFNLSGNKRYIVLEYIEIKNGNTKRRKEFDNEQEIKAFLEQIVPYIKNFDNEDNIIEIYLPDNTTLTIRNYKEIRDSYALYELNKKLKEVNTKKKKVNKLKGYTKIVGLSAGMLAGIVAFQKHRGQDAEKIYETEEFTVLESDDLNKVILETKENIVTLENENFEFEQEIEVNTEQAPSLSDEELEKLLEEYKQQETLESEEEQKENSFNIKNYYPNIGSKKDNDKKINVETEYGHLVQKYADIIGIDAELFECLLAQERGYHSSEKDKGGATGIGQIAEVHIGTIRKLTDVRTGETEEFEVTPELIKSLEGNIKTGASILQGYKNKYNGNTLIAFQAYNYGGGAMDKVLEDTTKATGKTKEEIINNPFDLSWLEFVHKYSELHRGGKSYGDPYYIEHILNFYNSDTLTLKYNDNGEIVSVNVEQNIENEKGQVR